MLACCHDSIPVAKSELFQLLFEAGHLSFHELGFRLLYILSKRFEVLLVIRAKLSLLDPACTCAAKIGIRTKLTLA